MKSLIINETELRVNGYAVETVAALGFEYTAVYYEPEVGNTFKLVSVDGALHRVGLLPAEASACEAYCAAFVAPPVYTAPAVVAVEDPVVPFVDAFGFLRGSKPMSELLDTEVAVPQSAVDQIQYHSTDMPVLAWNFSTSAFEGAERNDRRLVDYFTTASVGDQLDALWAMVDALVSNGAAVPNKTADMLAKIKAVKDRNP